MGGKDAGTVSFKYLISYHLYSSFFCPKSPLMNIFLITKHKYDFTKIWQIHKTLNIWLIVALISVGKGTEAKPDTGKGKTYQVPEFFEFNEYSFYDIEASVVETGKRCPQPKSGLSEYW